MLRGRSYPCRASRLDLTRPIPNVTEQGGHARYLLTRWKRIKGTRYLIIGT